MEELIIKSIPQLGTAGIAIVALVVLVKYMISSHKEERESRDKAFMAYMEANNHQKTDMVEKMMTGLNQSTDAQRSVGESLKQHTEVIAALIKKKR